MATATLTSSPDPPPPQKRFTVDEYHRLIDLGIVTKRDRCELVRGLIVERPVIKPPHATVVSRLTRRLFVLVQAGTIVRVQLPITLPPDSEPVPDFVIATGTDDDYETRHPGRKDILLAVEVSDSSLPDDQTDKLALYAANKLPVYWIVNLVNHRVEVYTQPRGGKNPTYRARQDYGFNDKVPVTLAGRTIGSIPVREILPR